MQEIEEANGSSEGVVTYEEKIQEEEVKLEKRESGGCEEMEEDYAEVSRRKSQHVETPPKGGKTKKKEMKQ